MDNLVLASWVKVSFTCCGYSYDQVTCRPLAVVSGALAQFGSISNLTIKSIL